MNIKRKLLTVGIVLLSGIAFLSAGQSALAAKHGASKSATTSKKTFSKIDIDAVQSGTFAGFSSGKWTEVAVSHKTHGKKVNWSKKSGQLTDKLTVTGNDIEDGHISLVNTRLSLNGIRETTQYKESKNKNKALRMLTVSPAPTEKVASTFSIRFYPKGTAAKLHFNNGVKDDKSKNRIVLWTQKGNHTEYFAQR